MATKGYWFILNILEQQSNTLNRTYCENNLGPSFPCLMINHGFIERPKLFWLLIQFTRLHLRFVHHSLVPDAIASKSLSSVAESWCMCCLLIMKQEPIQIRHEVSNQSMDLYNSSNLNGV
eukprot:1123433_1